MVFYAQFTITVISGFTPSPPLRLYWVLWPVHHYGYIRFYGQSTITVTSCFMASPPLRLYQVLCPVHHYGYIRFYHYPPITIHHYSYIMFYAQSTITVISGFMPSALLWLYWVLCPVQHYRQYIRFYNHPPLQYTSG